jgi:hypothetical protein
MKKIVLAFVVFTCSITAFTQTRISQPKTKAQQLNETYCSGLFSTEDGVYFDLQNDQSAQSARSYLNVLDWLQGRVAGLTIYLSRFNELIPFIRNSRAGIFVDEVQVNPGYLNALPVADIAMIKIIKGPFAGGFNSPGGAVAIYTIKGDDDDE